MQQDEDFGVRASSWAFSYGVGGSSVGGVSQVAGSSSVLDLLVRSPARADLLPDLLS